MEAWRFSMEPLQNFFAAIRFHELMYSMILKSVI